MEQEMVIDRKVFDALCESVGGDVEFIDDLLQTYHADAEGQIEAMQAALTAGDAETLRRAAHSLKSNSAGVGALTLAARCRELEMAAKAGELAGARERIDEIRVSYASARDALNALTQP